MGRRLDSSSAKRAHVLGPLLGAAVGRVIIVGLSATGIVWSLFARRGSEPLGLDTVAVLAVLGALIGVIAGVVAAGGLPDDPRS